MLGTYCVHVSSFLPNHAASTAWQLPSKPTSCHLSYTSPTPCVVLASCLPNLATTSYDACEALSLPPPPPFHSRMRDMWRWHLVVSLRHTVHVCLTRCSLACLSLLLCQISRLAATRIRVKPSPPHLVLTTAMRGIGDSTSPRPHLLSSGCQRQRCMSSVKMRHPASEALLDSQICGHSHRCTGAAAQ